MSVIHHTFGPLADRMQRGLARTLLVRPWKWLRGPNAPALERSLGERFGARAYAFGSGREALCAVLEAAGVGPGDEVIVQGYTCIVVPNAVEALGAVTVYADIDRDTLNLNVDEVTLSITPKTKAVVCQHTFGIPADTETLRTLCDARGLLLIEDCAHVLPDRSGPEEIGAAGDALILSFGRDKAVSGIAGGALVVRNPRLQETMKTIAERRRDLPRGRVARLLLYPLLYGFARPLYGSVGKAALALAGKTGLLVPIVTSAEKAGRMPRTLHRIPDACAALALEQWTRLDAINFHRRELTAFYLTEGHRRGWLQPEADGNTVIPGAIFRGLPLQKFPIFVRGAARIRAHLKTKGIHLDDGWTGCVVCPPNVTETTYEDGTDPQAEAACEAILSLPTHPGTTREDAGRLMEELDRVLEARN